MSKNKKTTGRFLKFGEQEHLEALAKKGSIFCRPMKGNAQLIKS